MAYKEYTKEGKVDADEIALIAQKQIFTSAQFKQPRMVEVLDNEDMYNFKLRPALQGRLNVPFDGVVMAGFVDTLVAQVNRPPKIEFEDPTGANAKGARKVSAAFERDKKKIRLAMKDRQLKKLAAISGRAIAKFYAESDPKYCPYLQVVDHLDFDCEPNGGGHLNDHYFDWQSNIFRSKEDLIGGAKSGWYDKTQVTKLISSYSQPDFKRNTDTFNNKNSRYISLGLDMEANNYIGGELFNLTEGTTLYKGKRYHVILDRNTFIWLRCVGIEEDFGSELTPFLSFASPQEDAFNFWNRGPADQMKPVAEAIRLNLNEVLNNNRKRNWDMKAVDANMFKDLKQLDWRQDGIVAANVPFGQQLSNGIYRFETPEINGALDLNNVLNNMAGENLGVNSQTKGDASEDKVGIYKGNQLQISKRMKLLSDSYEEFYEDLGIRYDWGLWDHAGEDEMVKLISADGIGWEKITNEDKDPDYIVSVITSTDEIVDTADERRVQADMLLSIEQNPLQLQHVNPKALVEEKLRIAKFDEEKIKKLMDTKSDVTDDLISEAKKAIEVILEGKDPGINQSATPGYLQYVSDWILDNSDDLKAEDKIKLDAYFEQHVPIAMKNAERKRFNDELAAGANPLGLETEMAPKATPTGEMAPETTVPPNPIVWCSWTKSLVSVITLAKTRPRRRM